MSRRTELLSLFNKTRRQWDYDEPEATFTRGLDFIDTAEVHHTGGRGPRDMSFEQKRIWLLVIERGHELFKGWSDIFYHVFVFADGEVWEGRDARRTSQSNISRALTVHLPGNNPTPTAAQYASLLRVCRWAADRPDRIRDHQMRPAATACAGDHQRRHTIPRLRQDLNMTEHTHLYADLSGLQDAIDAHAKGFWDTSDPALAASRSTVAVIANRVDNISKVRNDISGARIEELASQISVLTTKLEVLTERVRQLDEVGNEIEVTPEVLQVIVDEIQRRLSE